MWARGGWGGPLRHRTPLPPVPAPIPLPRCSSPGPGAGSWVTAVTDSHIPSRSWRLPLRGPPAFWTPARGRWAGDKGGALPRRVGSPVRRTGGEGPPSAPQPDVSRPAPGEGAGRLGCGASEDSRGEQPASPLAVASVLCPGREAAALGPGPLLSQELFDEGRGRHVHGAHLPEAGQPHRPEARNALHLGERAQRALETARGLPASAASANRAGWAPS